MEPLDDHYAPARARPSTISSAACSRTSPAGWTPAARSRSTPAGGERAELELAGARVLELLRGGVAPGNVAVVFREPGRYASLIEQVFDAYGIPYSIDRKVRLGHTGVGRGLLALMRCALPAGAPRTCSPTCARPGCSRFPAWRTGSRPSCGARAPAASRRRAIWERDRWPLDDVDRLRAAAGDPAGYVAELERRALRLFSAPHERVAAILRGPGSDEAKRRAAHAALRELRGLAARAPRHGRPGAAASRPGSGPARARGARGAPG